VAIGGRTLGSRVGDRGGAGSAEASLEDLKLEEVVSFTVPADVRSRRVMEKTGMTRNPADDFDHPNLPQGHPLRRAVLYRARKAGKPER
jgi:RimJ/RimL family protein N-acetyltransferase